jgi:nicotinate phosphoribosyltransferase
MARFGVRLDSGDFDSLSREVRNILDEAGFGYVKILITGGHDEHQVDRLARDGATIDIFGLGTKVGVSADAPWSNIAYKLVCYYQRPVMKLSPGKAYQPGAKQVFRFKDAGGQLSRDVVGLQIEKMSDGEPLLTQVMA